MPAVANMDAAKAMRHRHGRSPAGLAEIDVSLVTSTAPNCRG
jgi:hypothetical protein